MNTCANCGGVIRHNGVAYWDTLPSCSCSTPRMIRVEVKASPSASSPTEVTTGSHNMPNFQEIREEWEKVSRYPGDHSYKFGCCGGDYCDDPIKRDHNKVIADWWLSKFSSYLQNLRKEIARMDFMGIGGNFGEGYEAGYQKALRDVTFLLPTSNEIKQ